MKVIKTTVYLLICCAAAYALYYFVAFSSLSLAVKGIISGVIFAAGIVVAVVSVHIQRKKFITPFAEKYGSDAVPTVVFDSDGDVVYRNKAEEKLIETFDAEKYIAGKLSEKESGTELEKATEELKNALDAYSGAFIDSLYETEKDGKISSLHLSLEKFPSEDGFTAVKIYTE